MGDTVHEGSCRLQGCQGNSEALRHRRDAAEENVSFCEMIMALNDCDRFSVSACSDFGNALEGTDIVVASIEPGRTDCRYGGLVLPERYGILQSVGEYDRGRGKSCVHDGSSVVRRIRESHRKVRSR